MFDFKIHKLNKQKCLLHLSHNTSGMGRSWQTLGTRGESLLQSWNEHAGAVPCKTMDTCSDVRSHTRGRQSCK